jgi:hypothetical protein
MRRDAETVLKKMRRCGLLHVEKPSMSQRGRLRLVCMGWGCGEEGENFLGVVVAGEGTGGCDKDKRLGKILEREGKKEFDGIKIHFH